ncbi:MAG TPA: hypothetical protein DCS93_30595 [Microscillaceae bacterium]|nr:hypothetical protein [Microscillaceae bacterium]
MTIITQSLANETLEVALTSESQEFLDQLLGETLHSKNLVLDLPSAALDDPEEDGDDDGETKPKKS